MKTYLFIFFFLLGHFLVEAQVNVDSLKSVLNQYPADTARINEIIKAGRKLMGEDIEAANVVFKIAEQKANKTGIDLTRAVANLNLAQSYLRMSEAKEASIYYLKAKQLAEKLKNDEILGEVYLGLGGMYWQNKDNKNALNSFNHALSLCQKDNYGLRSSILGNIGMIYYSLSDIPDNNAVNGIRKDKNLVKKAIFYNRQAFKIAHEQQLKRKIITQGGNLCLEYVDLEKLDSAAYFLSIVEESIKDNQDPQLLTSFYSNKARLLRFQKKYSEAIEFYKKSVEYGKIVGEIRWVYDGYMALAETYEVQQDYKNAVLYYNIYINTKDSALNQENFAIAADLQNKYEAQKKENKILQLNAENKQKSTNNKVLIGLISGLVLLSFLGYRNFKSRQKIAEQQQYLQEQKIAELEKDKQLLSVNAMLKGQEEERNRIAKDLHDGLGGMLSGVKMSFTNMKENLIMSAENVGVFEQSISQLDSTISELRKIAHNLMPEALVKFGLNDAIKDFCTSIMSATHINIIYESMGEVRTLDNTANTYIYRIIQELINNAVKHAKPTQILVQLTTTTNKIMLTVEDNGQGLDSTKLAASKGIGITNIKHRVNYFKGTIHFDNNTPQGTVVNIELNV